MFSATVPILTTLFATLSLVAGQTSTSCNPLDTACPSDKGLQRQTFSTDFTKGQNKDWSVAAGTTINYSNMGAAFTIKSATDAPTIETNFYLFFGYVEVKLQAAPGTGIVSSIVLESDDLDEIDWEFLGGDDSHVQTNFFGKGNTTVYNRMVSEPVTTSTSTFHTYALNWTSSSLTWLIDGVAVRTLQSTDPLALGGKNYPQTPCRVKLGSWAGGASSSPGTVEWAGGKSDFSKGPFTMYVESVKITNYNPASAYKYSDRSGDWTSIKLENSNSTTVNQPAAVSKVGETTTASSTMAASVAKTNATVATASASASASTAVTSASSSTTSKAPISTFTHGSAAAGRFAGAGSFVDTVLCVGTAIWGLLLV